MLLLVVGVWSLVVFIFFGNRWGQAACSRMWVGICASAAACGGCLVWDGDDMCLTPPGVGRKSKGLGRGCVHVLLLLVGV